VRIHFKKLAVLLLLQSATFPAWAALTVLTCEPEWKALVEALAGSNVEAFSATTALQDPHHIEAKPSLIAKARNAQLVICTGAELEVGWLPLLLKQSANSAIQPGKPGYFLAADVVERLDVRETVDRSEGDVHASGNPHIHTDPRRLLKVAEALQQRLKELDPANAQVYQQKGEAFAARWRDKIQHWEQRAAPLRGKQVVVHHGNWRYLFDWLQMSAVADLEPKPGLPPTASHLRELLTTVAERKPAFIVIANYQPVAAAQWLSSQSGLKLVQLPFTVGGNAAATDLEALFDDTLARLLAGL